MWDVVPRGSEDLNVSELLLENIYLEDLNVIEFAEMYLN